MTLPPARNYEAQSLKVWRNALVTFGVALAGSACTVSGPSLQQSKVTGAIGGQGAGSNETEKKAETAMPLRTAGGKAKVALILPISGPGTIAVVAKAMKQAGEMALFDRPNAEFQLMVKDDRGTPEGAKAAAEEAINEGAEMILGPLLAVSVDAVTPVAAAARVPVIAFSNDKRVIKPGTYLLSFMPDQDVERIIGYSMAQGRRNYAALIPDDAYGRIVEEAFTRAVGSRQGNVVAIERYGRGGSSGMLEATRKLGDAINNPTMDGQTITADAILIPGEPDSLMSIGPLIAYARIDPTKVKLLGTGGWDSPNLGRDVTFLGAWYPAPDQKGWQSFSEKFSKTFGSPPPRIASVSFDAVGIALALSGAPAGVRFTTAGITRAGGFAGSDGTVRFQADGTAVRALAIHEVQAFGARVIEAGERGSQAAGSANAPASAPSAAVTPSANRSEQLN